MADGITITIDAAEVLAMLAAVGPSADARVHEASRVTADRVQHEARARARRRTGILQEAITIEEMGPPLQGFRVFVDEMTDARGARPDEFALWHEAGTQHMSAQPFMENSAALEEQPHLRRVSDALQTAIDEENA
jgi:hypothetical protein